MPLRRSVLMVRGKSKSHTSPVRSRGLKNATGELLWFSPGYLRASLFLDKPA